MTVYIDSIDYLLWCVLYLYVCHYLSSYHIYLAMHARLRVHTSVQRVYSFLFAAILVYHV